MASTPDWVPEEELALLANLPTPSQKQASQEEIALAILRDNAPLAAEIVAHLMTNSEKDTVRLAAAKYVMDRTLGKIPDAKPLSSENDPLAALFGSVLREPTANERANGGRVTRL